MANYFQILQVIFYAGAGLSFYFFYQSFKQKEQLINAFWCSLLTIFLNYYFSPKTLFGGSMDITIALPFSISIIAFLMISTRFVYLYHSKNAWLKIITGFIFAAITAFLILFLINLWLNVYFVSNRFPKTPIIQMANINRQQTCKHPYIYLKITPKANIQTLCPYGYGLIASIQNLTDIPPFIALRLPKSLLEPLAAINPKWQKKQ